jgi:hypothetical protein
MMDLKVKFQERLKRFVKNRYTYLFASILAIFFIHPFTMTGHVVLSIFFMLMMLAVLWTMELKRWFFGAFLVLACVSFAASLMSIIHTAAEDPGLDLILDLANSVTYIVFLFAAVLVMLVNIFSQKKITKRTILGGISVYFLMGIFWAFCYQLAGILDPDAVLFAGDTPPQYFEYMYFSFTTLTTLGYGDVLPMTYPVRSLAMLESTLGPIFIAVFIARLVGLSISQKDKRADSSEL